MFAGQLREDLASTFRFRAMQVCLQPHPMRGLKLTSTAITSTLRSASPALIRLGTTSAAQGLEPLPKPVSVKSPSSTTSSTAKGNAFEVLALHTLSKLGFKLTRVGGRADKGIDLLGTWELPACRLRAIVQCKALSRTVGPNTMRELEGTIGQAPRDRAEVTGTVGVLVGRTGATKGVRDALTRSTVPLVWVCVEDEAAEGTVRQLIWNERFARLAGPELGVLARYSTSGVSGSRGVVLTWKEKIWSPQTEQQHDVP